MERGFIGKLVLIIIALALLYYFFNWSIFDAVESEQGRATVEYIRNVLNTGWAYIRDLAILVWDKLVGLVSSR
ncbi:MAG: hypothetical protein Q8P21_01465 [bacterium]|nr:hypothetical protein [bacterium]